MYTIAIIGAGELGSRHLQGLKIANFNMNIEIVDPNEESLLIAVERYKQVAENFENKNIRTLKSIYELSEELDLVIIATSSAPRFEITKDLIRQKKIKNILFEKVLFQRVEEYLEIEKLLAKNKIHAWVNCPRRMYGFYKELKYLFADSPKLIFNVTGGDWGIGCNSIHFVDCLAFISNQVKFEINVSTLDKSVFPSKRSGYEEFSGIISATTERGDLMMLISQKDSNAPIVITIQSDKLIVVIDETNRLLHLLINGKWQTKEIQLPYQSQLTGIIAEQILIQGITQLTTFAESKTLHLSLINPMLNFYNDIKKIDTKICPIT